MSSEISTFQSCHKSQHLSNYHLFIIVLSNRKTVSSGNPPHLLNYRFLHRCLRNISMLALRQILCVAQENCTPRAANRSPRSSAAPQINMQVSPSGPSELGMGGSSLTPEPYATTAKWGPRSPSQDTAPVHLPHTAAGLRQRGSVQTVHHAARGL